MTPKQERFVAEYLLDLNATQAAIRAGYSALSAAEIGRQLLEKTGVAEAIAKAKAERSARSGLHADRVLEELARIAFSDMGDFADWSGDSVRLQPSTDVDTRCVVEVKETPLKVGGKALGIKLHDKVAALKLLGQHLGMFKEQHEVTGKDGGPIVVREVIVNLPAESAGSDSASGS